MENRRSSIAGSVQPRRAVRLTRRGVLAAALLLLGQRGLAADFASGEFQINTFTTGDQGVALSAIEADSDGDFVVVWTSDGQDGSLDGVFARRYASTGAPIGAEFQVNTYTTSYQAYASVAVDGDGDFVVVWHSYFGQDGDAQGVFAQRYASSGAALGTEFRVNTYTTGFQGDANVAAESDGDFVVAWTGAGDGGSFSGIFAQRYASSGAAVGTEFQVNTYTPNEQFHPGVAIAAGGDFVVVWTSGYQDGSQNGVFGQRYASGGAAIGTEFQINTFTTGTQSGRAVAAESDGDFVVAWTNFDNQDGSQFGVFGQRYASSGAAVGTEFQINTYTSLDQVGPSIAIDSDGDFVVVWSSDYQDGSLAGVFGQRYASSGGAVGAEFHVNSYTTANQGGASVALNDDGSFVVAWSSWGFAPESGQDGSDAGVFARTFAARCPGTPATGCIDGFAKGSLFVRDDQKLIAKLSNGPTIFQLGFGNPLVPGGTAYRLCLYDDAGNLAGDLEVDRSAASNCSGGGSTCWKALGVDPPLGKGFAFVDSAATSDGVSQILLKGGILSAGKSKISIKGRGANLPDGIAAALASTSAVTMQLLGHDAPEPRCFSATLSDITKQESDTFKAK